MIELAKRNIVASTPRWRERALFCVRYGHPAAFRSVVAEHRSGVPRPGIRPTAWQQEVGRAIADAYGVQSFDPETFVCRGRPDGKQSHQQPRQKKSCVSHRTPPRRPAAEERHHYTRAT